jgi:uncharacterized membrane protein
MQGEVLWAVLERDENPWTELAESFSIQFMRVFYPSVFAVLAVVGLVALWRTVRKPKQWSKPHAATVMGVMSMVALVSWTMYLPYKSLSVVGDFFYHVGIGLTMVTYCLLVRRWVAIVSPVHVYLSTFLHYLSIVCMGLVGVELLLLWMARAILSSDAFVVVTSMLYAYTALPIMSILVVTHLVAVVWFLYRSRHLFPLECRHLLRHVFCPFIPQMCR